MQPIDPVVLLTAPVGHDWHSDSKLPTDENLPFEHNLQALPLSKWLPASQTKKQLLDPGSEYVFSSHLEHSLAPERAKVPPSHCLQTLPFTADARPEVHTSQEREFATVDILPGAQLLQPLKPS